MDRESIRRVAAFLMLAVAGGCQSFRPVGTLTLADSAATTIDVDDRGHVWLGGPGFVREIVSDDSTHSLTLNAAGNPRNLGTAQAGRYWWNGQRLMRTEGDSATMTEILETDAAVLDPEGRWALTTEEMGAVVAYELPTLRPVWGWAAIGAASRAVAISPEGDRAYQAAAPNEFREGPLLLVRDLQTGRTLHRVETEIVPLAIVADPDGMRLVVAGLDEDGDAVVQGIHWRGGEPGVVWTESPGLGSGRGGIALRQDPRGGRVGILGLNENAGLRILDTETGDVIHRWRGAARDLAFGPRGDLFLLLPDQVLRFGADQ